jgi:hypothetical protein
VVIHTIYLIDVITKIVDAHPNNRIDDLMPWVHAAVPPLGVVA